VEEPLFPFFSEGDEHAQQHCYDCGMPLPEAGDPEVIYVPVEDAPGVWRLLPSCRRHWRDARQHERADSQHEETAH
jgi:hypothetical protein